MRLSRALLMLHYLRAKHLVCKTFLLVGHRVVQTFESGDELLQVPGVRLGDLLVGLHVL